MAEQPKALISGQVLDVRGLPPPDSLFNGVDIAVEFTGPSGGRIQKYPVLLSTNGQFEVQAVPQGNEHQLRAVYEFVVPPADSVVTHKTVTVYPGIGAHGIVLRLNTDWTAH